MSAAERSSTERQMVTRAGPRGHRRRAWRTPRRNPGARSVILALGALAAIALAAPGSAAASVGFEGPSFSGASSQPTGEKPQSKAWVTPDRVWWANMYNSLARRYEIHRLDRATRKWVATGTVVDTRSNSKADALWDGGKLYVATAGTSATSSSDSARVLRYSYNSSTRSWTLDSNFPVTVTTGGMKAIVMDKDSTGRVWITYTLSGKVYFAHSTTSETAWTAPSVLPVSGASNLLSEDISAVAAYGTPSDRKIGVMWSNQNDQAMYFAYHRDGDPDSSWTSNPAIKESEIADDHINLRSLQADESGRLFAATKTSLNATSAPLILLHVLDRGNVWKRHTFGRVQEDHSRPMVMIDRQNNHLYVFASQPCCGGGQVYYKRTSLSQISFSDGLGTLFMQDSAAYKINNPTSTKQEVNGDSDIVVIAGVDGTQRYWYNELDLGSGTADTTPPETMIDSGPSGTVTDTSAGFDFSSSEANSTFECSLDEAPFTSCASPKAYTGLGSGSHTFQVRATDSAGNVDASPASRTWTVESTPANTQTFAVEADAYVSEARPSLNFGAATRLKTADGNGRDEHSYLRFNVSGVSRPIVSAKVRTYAADKSVNGPAIFGVDGAWSELGLTWATRPLAVGMPSDDKGSVQGGTYVDFDVTPMVNGDGSYNFVLVPNSTDGLALAAREEATVDRRPTLVLTLG